MVYRDDRQALALQVAELERENTRLCKELEVIKKRLRKASTDGHEQRRTGTRDACALCGGTLLPVAIFAGHDVRAPLPLKMSTLRFTNPEGGFTHSAPIRSLVCASCGYIQNFIDIDASKSVTD